MPRRDTKAKDARAAQLRVWGLTYARIAEELGYRTPQGAWLAVDRGLARWPRPEPTDAARMVTLAQIDDLFSVSYDIAMGDRNPDRRLRAIDRANALLQRKCAMLGLDAPTKHETWTIDAIDAAIREAEAELAEKERVERAEAG